MKITGPDAIVEVTDPDGDIIPMRWRHSKTARAKNYADGSYEKSNHDWFCDQCLDEWGYSILTNEAGPQSKKRPLAQRHLHTFGFGGDEDKMHTFKQV